MFDIVRFFTGIERYEVYEGDKITIFSEMCGIWGRLLGIITSFASRFLSAANTFFKVALEKHYSQDVFTNFSLP